MVGFMVMIRVMVYIYIALADPVGGGLRGLHPTINFQKKIMVIRVAVVINLLAWPL